MRPFACGTCRSLVFFDNTSCGKRTLLAQLDEPYRTVLGHLRHEIGHWYWNVLIAAIAGTPHLARFRELFGDETQDYAAALEEHDGRPAGDDWVGTRLYPFVLHQDVLDKLRFVHDVVVQ